MTARDMMAGVSSLLLLLSTIGLCLLFALYDRLIAPMPGRDRVRRRSPAARPQMPALGRN